MARPAPPASPITPCLEVNPLRMQRNIDKLAQHLAGHGVTLRPHLKTCKNIDIARLLLAGQAGGATVSTLAEADYFHAHGISNLLYAVGVAPGKLPAVIERLDAGMQLSLILDHVDTARACAAVARQSGHRLKLLLEIDADGQRAGLRPDSPMISAIVDTLGEDCELAGVMVHAGGSYACSSVEGIIAMAETERLAALDAVGQLRALGLAAPVVSVGSTPTASLGQCFDGITEVRAGVHVFQDLVMAGLGVCSVDDIALSVMTEVIGHRPEHNRLIIDAGWMALSRDLGRAPNAPDFGYGLVCDDHWIVQRALVVAACNQEHGLVSTRDGKALDFARYPIGTRLRILPNHACATAAQHSGYWIDRSFNEASNTKPGSAMTWLARCQGW
ncbi:MAG: alanine racemase [Wenzhouxiangella sp.]